MNIGDKIPALPFQATEGTKGNLADYAGQWLVLYFYPKDSTPGCTLESQDFRDHAPSFTSAGATIIGISRDSVTSHERFKANHCLPFLLISDCDETICQAFGVMKMKSMYGKQVRGIERSTFLIDPTGTIRHIWRGVKVPEHVKAVLSILQTI